MPAREQAVDVWLAGCSGVIDPACLSLGPRGPGRGRRSTVASARTTLGPYGSSRGVSARVDRVGAFSLGSAPGRAAARLALAPWMLVCSVMRWVHRCLGGSKCRASTRLVDGRPPLAISRAARSVARIVRATACAPGLSSWAKRIGAPWCVRDRRQRCGRSSRAINSGAGSLRTPSEEVGGLPPPGSSSVSAAVAARAAAVLADLDLPRGTCHRRGRGWRGAGRLPCAASACARTAAVGKRGRRIHDQEVGRRRWVATP